MRSYPVYQADAADNQCMASQSCPAEELTAIARSASTSRLNIMGHNDENLLLLAPLSVALSAAAEALSAAAL